MQYSASLTKKSQATIPAPIRKKLGIKPNSKIIFEIKNEEVTIKPVPDFFAMKGSVKSSKFFNIEALDQSINKAIKKEYGQKFD